MGVSRLAPGFGPAFCDFSAASRDFCELNLVFAAAASPHPNLCGERHAIVIPSEARNLLCPPPTGANAQKLITYYLQFDHTDKTWRRLRTLQRKSASSAVCAPLANSTSATTSARSKTGSASRMIQLTIASTSSPTGDRKSTRLNSSHVSE